MKKSSIIITILLILVLGLGGYIVYDKVLIENSLDTSQNDDDEKRKVNSYELFRNNLLKEREKSFAADDGYYYSTMADSAKTVNKNYYIVLKSNGDLEVTESGKTDVIGKNVLSFYVIYNELNGVDELYFINYDGSVSWVSFVASEETNKYKITNNLGNLKEIVSIVSGDSHCQSTENVPCGGASPLFIDINGNVN